MIHPRSKKAKQEKELATIFYTMLTNNLATRECYIATSRAANIIASELIKNKNPDKLIKQLQERITQ